MPQTRSTSDRVGLRALDLSHERVGSYHQTRHDPHDPISDHNELAVVGNVTFEAIALLPYTLSLIPRRWIPPTLILNLNLKQCPTSYRPFRFRMMVIFPYSLRLLIQRLSLLPVFASSCQPLTPSTDPLSELSRLTKGATDKLRLWPDLAHQKGPESTFIEVRIVSSRWWWWDGQKYSKSSKIDADLVNSVATKGAMDKWR